MNTYPNQIGPYRLRHEIGRSALYVDFRAEDTRNNQEVALKLPGDSFSRTSARLTHFVNAGQRAAQLEHPNIVPVYAAGEIDGHYYIASAHLPGERLTDLLANRETPLDPEKGVEIVADIAMALDYAHEHGINHDGLTTDNIIVAADGRALVADFCLAEGADVAADHPADSQPAFETFFLAPEQLHGDVERDQRVDVFALGVVTYAMLTRRLPFEADSQGALLSAIVNEPSFPAQTANPDLPTGIAYVLGNALVKEPDVRYGDVGEFYDALVAGLAWNPAAAAVASSPTAGGGRRLGGVAVALVGLIAIVAAVFFVLRPSSDLPTNNGTDGGPSVAIVDTADATATANASPTATDEGDGEDTPTAAAVADAGASSDADVDANIDDATNTPTSTPTTAPTDRPTVTPPPSATAVSDRGEGGDSADATVTVDGLVDDGNDEDTEDNEGDAGDDREANAFASTAGEIATASPTNTPRPTVTSTRTPRPTATSTNTPRLTATSTNTSRPTATSTNTPRPTATSTNTLRPTATSTNTPRPTATSTNTPRPTATSTNTLRPTATSTNTSRPTATSTNTPRPTATSTNTPRPTATNTPNPTATNTPAPTATDTPNPTATATNTRLPLPTSTPTDTPLPPPTDTPLPLPTPTFTATPTVTPIPAGAVQLLLPVDGGSGNDSQLFQWNANVQPGEGQAFELVFWRPDQNPLGSGFGLASPTTNNEVTVSLSALDGALGDLLEPGEYLWGLLLVQTDPYQRIQFMGSQHNYRFYREGDSGSSGGPPSSGE